MTNWAKLEVNFDANRKPLPDGELRFLSQIEDRYDAATTGFAGMEICNRHTDAKIDSRFYDYLNDAANNPDAWRKVLEHFKVWARVVCCARKIRVRAVAGLTPTQVNAFKKTLRTVLGNLDSM